MEFFDDIGANVSQDCGCDDHCYENSDTVGCDSNN